MVILTKEKLILLNLNQGFFDFRKILFNLWTDLNDWVDIFDE